MKRDLPNQEESPFTTHEELSAATGLKHGTGALCCKCPQCNCIQCWIKRQHSIKKAHRYFNEQEKHKNEDEKVYSKKTLGKPLS